MARDVSSVLVSVSAVPESVGDDAKLRKEKSKKGGISDDRW